MTVRCRLKTLLLAAAMVATLGTAGCARSESGAALTVYSAAGLGDWYKPQFARFTRDTGIKVDLFEGGSGELVSRVNSPAVWERTDTDGPVAKADLLVTLPPFIQKAEKAGLLQASGVDTTGITAGPIGPGGTYVPIAGTALCFIVNPDANPQPASWSDLLKPQFKGRLQYSTPGESGSGTALLLLLQHLMGKQGALDYLAKLHANSVGPAASAAILQPKVDSGDLLVANGDVQMNLATINNHGAKFTIFFPAMPDNSRTTVSLPYVAGVTAGTRWPEAAKKLLAFLLSKDTQISLYTEAFGIPVRGAVPGRMSPRTPSGALHGVQPWVPEWDTVLKGLEGDIAAYRDAIR